MTIAISHVKPSEKNYGLVVVDNFHSLVPENEGIYCHLHIYSSENSRIIEAKKMKRRQPNALFISWNFTIKDIVNQGKVLLIRQSEKILDSDKKDIIAQLKHSK